MQGGENMSERCDRCKLPHPDKATTISFQHNNLTIFCFKPKGICPDCQKWLLIKDFDNYLKSFLRVEYGMPVIDWFSYFMIIALRKEKQESVASVINDLLLSIGVFSYAPEGRWEIRDSITMAGMNPRAHDFYLYFSRREDAVGYAYFALQDHDHDWEICHVDRIVSRQEAVKEMREKMKEME